MATALAAVAPGTFAAQAGMPWAEVLRRARGQKV